LGGRLQQFYLPPQPHEGVPRLFFRRERGVVEAAQVDPPPLPVEPQRDGPAEEFDRHVRAFGQGEDVSAAKRFFKKVMRADHRRLPFTIGTDKHASYPEAFAASVKEKVLPFDCKPRRVKYLNNVTEQDNRAIRKRWRAAQCFRSFHAAERTLEGIESLHMMREGRVKRLGGRDSVGQARFVASLFRIAA
jgi:hypothetical protein